MIKGIFWILLFLFLGEGISFFIQGLVPGSVLGMILMFLALSAKIVNADDVRGVAHFLTRYMALFFVPAAIGVISAWDLISRNWLALTVISIITTILVIAVVALIQEQAEKRKKQSPLKK